jgi:alpha-tubulin suppressor-like RCC1 family protein
MKFFQSTLLALCVLACQTTHAIEPQISVGPFQNIAVTSEGTVFAWSGTTPPTKVNGMRPVTAVAAGVHHSVALAENGFVYEWGYSPYQAVQFSLEHPSLSACEKERAAAPHTGQDANPCAKEEKERDESVTLEKAMRIPGVLPTKAVAAADGVTVILARNGEVYCWSHDQLPQRVPGLDNIKSISVGASHGVALREDGAVLTWGGNVNGALGHPTPQNSADQSICGNVEAQVVLNDAVAIGTGASSSFALQAHGEMWGWGLNTFHKVATPPSFDTPRRIATVSAAAEVVGGRQNFMARTSDGKIFAWGNDYNFTATAEGKNQQGANPIDMTFDNIVQLSAYDHILALTRDGYVCSWGDNASSQALWNNKSNLISNPAPIVLADGTTPFNLYTGKDAPHQQPARICGKDL